MAPPPPPPPPPPRPQRLPKIVKVIPRQFDAGKLMAPKTIPKDIAMIKEERCPLPLLGVVGGVPGGVPGGAPGRRHRWNYRRGAYRCSSASPSAASRSRHSAAIRVGGNVPAANLIRKVQPVYPPLAKQARIQGTVRFTAIIGKDGTIQNLQLFTGHPLLVQAAGCRPQWVYRPTLLNGEPVEVVTQIDVNFTLSQ